jgi:hypothetical protein
MIAQLLGGGVEFGMKSKVKIKAGVNGKLKKQGFPTINYYIESRVLISSFKFLETGTMVSVPFNTKR